MMLNAYSILDTKSGAFAAPFFAFNDAMAQRSVAVAVREGDSMLAKFPSDYQLFRLGRFDDASGELVGEVPTAVCNLISLRETVHAS